MCKREVATSWKANVHSLCDPLLWTLHMPLLFACQQHTRHHKCVFWLTLQNLHGVHCKAHVSGTKGKAIFDCSMAYPGIFFQRGGVHSFEPKWGLGKRGVVVCLFALRNCLQIKILGGAHAHKLRGFFVCGVPLCASACLCGGVCFTALFPMPWVRDTDQTVHLVS